MSHGLIKRYKKSIRVRFQSDEVETGYHKNEESRGRRSSVFAFSILCLINLVFCYVEYRALGVKESSLPMFGFIISALAALGNALLSQLCRQNYRQNIRLLLNGALSILVVMVAVSLNTFSPYYTVELAILIVWLATLNAVPFIITSTTNVVLILLFIVTLPFAATPIPTFWIALITAFLFTAAVLGGYLSYLLERQRRMLFLQTEVFKSMTSQQESWAFTLIDLDMALSGILNFKELIDRLKEYLEPVIKFESYVLTSLEGQGPKPVADKIEGDLFENEERTFWSEDLLNKLTQTRQSTVSAEHEVIKGFMGMEREKFTSYRLDVPVFNDSKLMGVISLRRSDEAFDDLDMISSLSIATQAMLIYKRTIKNSTMVPNNPVPAPVIRKTRQSTASSEADTSPQTLEEKMLSTTASNIHFTDQMASTTLDEVMAPSDLVKKIKAEEESTKKTITLLSRENADKIAVDKYRSAAVGGEPLSILIMEVDGLSKLREQDGDQVAYKVFAAIVKYIFSNVDKGKDILGRYGQNGLSVLMPQVDMNAAEKFAEKIRQFVERARYKTAYGEKSATLSIGVAAITDDTGDYGSMVKRADMALFVAKKNGRNCVKVRL